MKKPMYPRYFFVPDMQAYTMLGKNMSDYRVKLQDKDKFTVVDEVKIHRKTIEKNLKDGWWIEIPEAEVVLIF